MILVSSCLAGKKCRYNATSCPENTLATLVEQKKAIMVCPELLGGFSTPREPAEIIHGTGEDVLNGTAQVINKSGIDVTEQYLLGAHHTLELVKKHNVTHVVLKENSPSCGSSLIYNGEFNGQKITGEGVTTALLRKNGITVLSENELTNLF
ncbi:MULTISPECIES: DUF523 domain-containing protein [Bacillus]|uniref:DUF523 domain-containing protein n=1 Tax=Bacillus TaxID=1386 RepID=UPI0003162672|nr:MULTISPECIES: DUF523 domain-containing protein [Bacillus]